MTPKLPQGFRASGTTCGIKESGQPDLALFVSDTPATAVGVFTSNRVVGAPVILGRERVPTETARAVILNSGNANACTGERGLEDACQMTADVATALSCEAEQVIVCSTGIIGVPLPMDVIRPGIPKSVEALDPSEEAFKLAASAMMTTDTFAKLTTHHVGMSSGSVRVAGAAKGAAMIAPNMATMLCVIMTDAKLTAEQCDTLLRYSVDRTFNCISVDGHMSTSDTVLLFANGATGAAPADEDDLITLRGAVCEVCEELATAIIRDAEGADHFVQIDVEGFDSEESAFRIAREVAESALVKTAIAGNDPNWGRITSAAGYAGIEFDPDHLSLIINETTVFRSGNPVNYDESDLSNEMQSNRDVFLRLVLSGGPHSGTASSRFWTSDLTQEYVRLNSEYTT